MDSTTARTDRDRSTVLGSALLLLGLGIAGYGASLHLRLSGRLQAGNCDGCAPWHPLFVVAPLVVGSVLAVAGGYLASRG